MAKCSPEGTERYISRKVKYILKFKHEIWIWKNTTTWTCVSEMTFTHKHLKRKNKSMSNMLRKLLFTLTVSIKFHKAACQSGLGGKNQRLPKGKKRKNTQLWHVKNAILLETCNTSCAFMVTAQTVQQLSRNKRFKLSCNHFQSRHFLIDPDYYTV